MANWILISKSNVSSPVRCRSGASVEPKDLQKGFTLTVATPSTGEPAHKDVQGALLLAGFCKEEAEAYDGGSWKNNFEGKEVGDVDHKLSDKQHRAWVNKENYSAFKKGKVEAEREAKKDREEEKKKKGCCPSSSLSNSICDAIIDSIPCLRCIIDCCC